MIPSLDRSMVPAIQSALDQKTKPIGALGVLETLAAQLCLVQRTLRPAIARPAVIVFAGDHGIAAEGVSAYPSSVTAQMVRNFLGGGAAINVFCRLNDIDLTIVDAGVAEDFAEERALNSAKIGKGTRNFRREPAMTQAACAEALARGAAVVDQVLASGSNVIGFGDMGIGNTSAAAALMARLTRRPIADCVGRGTGLDEGRYEHKKAILEEALHHHPDDGRPLTALATFGGFEMAMMCGGMLRAAERGCLILVDGFPVSAAFLVAAALEPEILSYAVFSHESAERGHRALLQHLGARAILHLDMRLGEGTGAAMVVPILRAAAAFMNEMATFDGAGIARAGSSTP